MTVETESGQENALAFSNAFLQMMRLLKLYDVDNVNFEEPLSQMKELAAKVVSRFGSLRLQAEEGMIYFNKEPLRGGKRAFTTIHGLVQTMESLGIAEIAVLSAVGAAELRTLAGLVKRAQEQEEEGVRLIQEGLEEAGLKDRLYVHAPGETTGRAIVTTVEIDEKTYFPLAYARTLVLLREYVKNLRVEELNRYFTQKLHRAVQEIVNLTPQYFHRFLGLAAVRGTDAYIFTHMAATGLLSVCVGHRMGLGKLKLSDLGLAAMLHGVGWFRTDPGLVEKSELSPEEKFELGKHPYRALGAYLEARKISTKMLTAAVTSFQFDLHKGRTPVRIPPAEVHPFVQIIRICSDYTTLTSDQKDRRALLPDQALKQMIDAKPGTYDPMVLTVFTNMMGLYPTGSVVSLSTGEVAVVVHPNPERPKRPLVAVVLDGEGNTVDGDFLDLADDGVPSRITGSVDPQELGLNIPDYLMS